MIVQALFLECPNKPLDIRLLLRRVRMRPIPGNIFLRGERLGLPHRHVCRILTPVVIDEGDVPAVSDGRLFQGGLAAESGLGLAVMRSTASFLKGSTAAKA